jgi:hypothetical protein
MHFVHQGELQHAAPPLPSWKDMLLCIAAFLYFSNYSSLCSFLLNSTAAACIPVLSSEEEPRYYLLQDMRVQCGGAEQEGLQLGAYNWLSVLMLLTYITLPPIAVARHISYQGAHQQLDEPSTRYRFGFL